MIDIHSHLLPAFDDGPPSINHTKQMLELAAREGTRTIVATPHILDITDYDREDEIREKFAIVQELVKTYKLDLEVLLGGEIYLYPDTQLDHFFSTLNNNRRTALVEFTMRQIPDFIPQKLFDFLMAGYQPILAHPERFLPIVKNPRYAYKFAQMGVGLQMNAGSILGVFGDTVKDVAHALIEHNCIHLIASDGHNTNSRSISLAEARDYVENRFGKDRANLFFYENPRRAVAGEDLLRLEPIPFEESKKGIAAFWRNLKRKIKFG